MNRPDKEMKQGRVFSCQITHFCAKCIWNKIIQVILLIFNPRFWFSLLFLNFSDLCEGEVEGQRLIFLSFFFSTDKGKGEERNGRKMLVFSLFPYLLRYFISPTFLAGDYSKRKSGGNIWNQEGGKVSFFYLFLFVLFSLFFFTSS